MRTRLNWLKRVRCEVCFGVIWMVLGWACATGLAAVPTLTGVLPFGVNPGESIPVKIAGKLGGKQSRVWTDEAGLLISAPDASGNAWMRVAPEASWGVHWVRLVNDEGVSAPARVMVGGLRRAEEKEPNDRLEEAQKIEPLPAWIQGQLDRSGDVDGYALKLRGGVPVFLRADAYELGSAVDLHLNVVDARGQRVAMATDGRNLDPSLVFTPSEDGVYVVQVAGFAHPPTADVFFAGSVKCPYLVSVSDQPVATRVFPAVVPLEGSVEGVLRGPGMRPEGEKIRLDRSMVRASGDLGAVQPKGAVAPLSVVCSRFPVRLPKVREGGIPPLLEVPGVVGGELAANDAFSEWGVSLKKGQKMRARVWSRSLGLNLEGEVSVWSPSGEAVAANPNPADVFAEPVVSWTAACGICLGVWGRCGSMCWRWRRWSLRLQWSWWGRSRWWWRLGKRFRRR